MGGWREAPAELTRKHGVSEATLYNWKARYGGLDVSQLRKLKELEVENGRLKKMYAELSLAHHALQDAVEKKAIAPAAKSDLVNVMVTEHGLSVRQACRTARLARSAFYAPRRLRDDGPIIELSSNLVYENLIRRRLC